MVTYLPGIEFIVGSTMAPIAGSPIVSGLLLLLLIFVLWAYVGAGLEAGVALFIPFLIFLANQGLLPMWALILTSIGLAAILMFMFRRYSY